VSTEREALPVLDAILTDGHSSLVPVRGWSMRPSLVEGDVAVVAPFLGLPRQGQVVVARGPGSLLVVYRLVDVEMRTGRRIYRLRGDAEKKTDTGVLREDLLGRVIAVVRDGRRLSIEHPSFAPPAILGRGTRRRRGRRTLRVLSLVVTVLLCAPGAVAAHEGSAALARKSRTFAPTADYRLGPGDVLTSRPQACRCGSWGAAAGGRGIS
jgi:peptidase S24-like protein